MPAAVLIHGGYWKQQWTIDNTPITSIVPDLLAKGFGVVELEYRRRGDTESRAICPQLWDRRGCGPAARNLMRFSSFITRGSISTRARRGGRHRDTQEEKV